MQNRKGALSRGPEPMAMRIMRLWLWLVPIAIVAAAVGFSALAALDGRWGLLAVMIVMGLFGLGLMVLHWWLLYRFGAGTGGER